MPTRLCRANFHTSGYFPYVHGALLLNYSSRIGHYSTILPLRMQEPLLVVARMRNCGGDDVMMVMMISRKPAHTVPGGKRPPEHQKPENGRLSRRGHFKKSTCHEPHAEFWWHVRYFGGIFLRRKKGSGSSPWAFGGQRGARLLECVQVFA